MKHMVEALLLALAIVSTSAGNPQPPDNYERQLTEYDRRVQEQRQYARQQALVLYSVLALICLGVVYYMFWATRRYKALRQQNQEFMDRALAQNERMIQILESIHERLKGGSA
jgi:type VI protein secretion system component VasK